jgi:hypothetical protein
MRDTNGGPLCPKPTRLRELAQAIEDDRNLNAKENADLLDALDWLATSLENRSLYHKKQQIKNKVLRSLAAEYGLTDQANVITDETLHSLVSSGKPDLDVVNINTNLGDGDEKA